MSFRKNKIKFCYSFGVSSISVGQCEVLMAANPVKNRTGVFLDVSLYSLI
jgi:hypothetical protein